MKNLVTKVGIAATSVLLASISSIEKANALTLEADVVGSLYYATDGVAFPNTIQEYPTAGEVGEFVYGEVRTYAEYDISSFAAVYAADLASQADADPFNDTNIFLNSDFDLGFNLFSELGSGDIGTTGGGATNASPFKGIIQVLWYAGTALGTPKYFTPAEPIAYNPLFEFDMNDYGEGDRIEFDVSNFVKDLIVPGNPIFNQTTYFGIVLKPFILTDEGELGTLGSCGPISGAERTDCSGAIFNNFGVDAVPTPAAVLPTILGFVSAALRKKKKDENEMEA